LNHTGNILGQTYSSCNPVPVVSVVVPGTPPLIAVVLEASLSYASTLRAEVSVRAESAMGS
jgi:hypothetical protein